MGCWWGGREASSASHIPPLILQMSACVHTKDFLFGLCSSSIFHIKRCPLFSEQNLPPTQLYCLLPSLECLPQLHP